MTQEDSRFAEDSAQPGVGQPSVVRMPPYAKESEQSVLGGLMLDNLAWERVGDLVQEGDFYLPQHRVLYRTISTMIDKGQPADVITVQEELERNGELDEAGGAPYLGSLVANAMSAVLVRQYAAIVRERSIFRRLAEAGIEITESAYNPQGCSAADLLDNAERQIFQIAEQNQRTQQGFTDMPQLVNELAQHIEMLANRDDADGITGTATGFIDLDRMTAGLQNGDLIIVAGRPSMGKTAFAMNIAENVALQSKKAVAVFSMEMGAAQLGMRLLGSIGRLDQQVLRTGRLRESEWGKFADATRKLSNAPIFIDDTPALNAHELRARARRLARQCAKDSPLGLIVIDYLQLMTGGGRYGDNRASELSEVSRSLKALARELDVPVIALSQLSRKCEDRTDKRPMMSDLRESGAIEQDADLIVFMYRDVYYNENTEYKDAAEAIISKHRNGPTGKIWLQFLSQYARFENSAMKFEET